MTASQHFEYLRCQKVIYSIVLTLHVPLNDMHAFAQFVLRSLTTREALPSVDPQV